MNLVVLDVLRAEVRAFLRQGPTPETIGRDLGFLLGTLPVAEGRSVAAGLAAACDEFLLATASNPKPEPVNPDTGLDTKGDAS